jgi:hypothetical protein
MNSNWPRWLFASITKYFNDNRNNIAMFIEGQDRETERLDSYFELRIDGPFILQQSKDYWQLDVEINVLICVTKSRTDFHKQFRLQGALAKLFTDIPIYKLGDGPDDDQTILGCLKLSPSQNFRDAVRVSNFGQIQPELPLLQSTIEAHFEITLDT